MWCFLLTKGPPGPFVVTRFLPSEDFLVDNLITQSTNQPINQLTNQFIYTAGHSTHAPFFPIQT